MKKSLQSKLMKYSLTAAAVAISGANLNAQVQYSGLINANVTSSYDIDLNNDAVNDFQIKVSIHNGTVANYKYVNLNVANSNNEWMQTKYAIHYFVKPLLKSIVVSVSQTWSNTYGQINMGRTMQNSTSEYPNSFFIGQGDKYIGVKIVFAKGTHYGWIRVNVPSGGNNLTVKDWAYEQTANKAIKTGQTTTVNNDEYSTDNLNISYGPNPTSSYVNISADDNYKVEILDMAGKVVLETQMKNNKVQVDLSNLDAGIYIAKLSNQKLSKTLKIVKN